VKERVAMGIAGTVEAEFGGIWVTRSRPKFAL
jgi:hypothetical protein